MDELMRGNEGSVSVACSGSVGGATGVLWPAAICHRSINDAAMFFLLLLIEGEFRFQC